MTLQASSEQPSLFDWWGRDLTPHVPCSSPRSSKHYEAPILAAREPWATDRQKADADGASSKLSGLVNQVSEKCRETLGLSGGYR